MPWIPISTTRSRRSRDRRAARCSVEVLESRQLLSATDVLSYHNDKATSGQYPFEKKLTPRNVNAASFGKIASLPVDGQVYAQPLFVSSLRIGNVVHRDVVIVATQHDSVYAFDTSGPTPQLLWHSSFINSDNGVTT